MPEMTGDVIQSVWPILLVLAWFLVKCVTTVLLAERQKVIDVHDRVRRCMELRKQYMASQQTPPAE